MNGSLFAIYDRKSMSFAPPMFFANVEVCKRTLRMEFEEKRLNPVVAYPGDYELWRVGRFSTDDAAISCDKEMVCSCVELVTKAVDMATAESMAKAGRSSAPSLGEGGGRSPCE